MDNSQSRSPRAIRPARLLGTAAIAAVAVASSAGTAFAAGSPYGGGPVLPSGGVPGGFRNVVTAFTVSKYGHVMTGRLNGVLVRLAIPRGAAPFGEQVIVTKASLGFIRKTEYRRIPRTVAHDKAIFALGVLFQKNQRAVGNRRFARLELSGKKFTRSDYVVVYSSAAHGFVPAPKGHARVVNGHVIIRFGVGTEFAVLAK